MPTFAYTAKGRDGATQKGNMTAENRQALIQALQSRGLTPDQSSIKEVAATKAGALSKKKIKSTDLLIFTRQLSTMVNAGLPLLQSLDILAEQADDPNFCEIINSLAQNVEAGETFSETLRRFPRSFPDLYVSMVRAGEAGGDLDGVLLRLADMLEANAQLRRNIIGAMTYPVVAFGFIIIIAGGLIVFMVPKFKAIFESMGGELPIPTQILIQVSDTLQSWKAVLVVAFFVGIVMAIRAFRNTPNGRFKTDAFILRLPVAGNLATKAAVSKFSRTLATLTRSGVNILQALEITENTAGNEVFAKAIRDASDSVRNGETLADPMARAGCFPPMVTRMIGVGEKTGALEVMLEKIADFYDSEVKTAVESLTSLIEPILLLFMGITVGSIVIALVLPILNISQLATPQ